MGEVTKFKRVLLKLSGEAISGENGKILSHSEMSEIAYQIKRCTDLGCSFAIIIGA